MDAGGLAQMTYNNNNGFNPTGSLGVPGAGFASRGKATQLKRLSVASPPKVASISEDDAADPVPTPRTSRSHLLAGLRTQPKTPGPVPSSAPFGQLHHDLPMNAAKRPARKPSGYDNVPHTATGSGFPISTNSYMHAGQQFYSLPEQVLAPPTVQFDGADGEQWDPQVAAQLMATELYLQQRQQQLQQQLQLLNGPQFQDLSLNGNSASPRNVPLPQTPMTPHSGNSLYLQQMQAGSAPIAQEVPGHPGLFQVYNPMTGQVSYVANPSDQQDGSSNSPASPATAHIASPPASGRSLGNRNGYVQSPLGQNAHSFNSSTRVKTSPPKQSPPPASDFEVQPLPPPSANAFRRGGSNGHKKTNSFVVNTSNETLSNLDRNGPRSALTPRVGLPQTPMTGTFGPGQNRAGEHPVRQPRGPPAIEELTASPTTKHEGSKNFVKRQRNKALFTLRKAGIDRAAHPSSESSYSGPGTPSSEPELNFESDNSDTASYRSGSLSGKPSMGSLKAAAIGAIGSERKMRREGSQESVSSFDSFSDVGEEKKTGRKSLVALMEAEKKRTGLF